MSNNKKFYPSGSLNEADLRRDISKQTKTPADNNVLHILEANEWIESIHPTNPIIADCLRLYNFTSKILWIKKHKCLNW